jgi:predicted short-subunit dehydrogenase-like oxidoreductase (DUF2520 family)
MSTDKHRSASPLSEPRPGHVPAAGDLAPLAVIGVGRVGQAIARSAASSGIEALLAGRKDSLAAAASSRTALLCVPDGEISRACAQISAAIPPLELVGHTSGAQTLGCLDGAREQGADTFSIHPLQTIPDPETSLAGAPCAIAGSSPRAERAAEELAAELGMAPFSVPDEVRAAYHAAASMASNFLVTLEESAAELLEQAGVDNARELLAPLVLRTAANWAERGDSALTGPIVRGDEQTVEQHRTAIASVSPTLAPLYDALAERTLEIAAWHKELD